MGMDNTREKLIELCEKALNYDGTGREIRFTGGDVTPCLIANGVTVQEWIPVTERLPDNSVKYIVVADSKYHSDMRVVSAKSLMVEEFWGMPIGYFAHGQQVTHWMPLPEPPKGE